MAKTARRVRQLRKPVDARLLAKQDEKRVLAKYLREVRAVNKLTRVLKAHVRKADDDLRGLAAWLGTREWHREALEERTDKRPPLRPADDELSDAAMREVRRQHQPEPANT